MAKEGKFLYIGMKRETSQGPEGFLAA